MNIATSDSTGKLPTLGAFWDLLHLLVNVLVGARQHMGADQVATQLKTIVEEAKKQLKIAQEYQKRCFDAHYCQLEFESGQKVLLSTKNLKLPGSKKLHPRWVRPFKDLQHVGAAAYKLDLAGRFSQLYPSLHVSYLKLHMPGRTSGRPPEPVE